MLATTSVLLPAVAATDTKVAPKVQSSRNTASKKSQLSFAADDPLDAFFSGRNRRGQLPRRVPRVFPNGFPRRPWPRRPLECQDFPRGQYVATANGMFVALSSTCLHLTYYRQ